jgi:hypothetical protein
MTPMLCGLRRSRTSPASGSINEASSTNTAIEGRDPTPLSTEDPVRQPPRKILALQSFRKERADVGFLISLRCFGRLGWIGM